MTRSRFPRNRWRGLAVLSVGLCAQVVLAPNAGAAVSPIQNPAAGQVTADALPTVQIDGVVWTQSIIGNSIYAGGQFTQARPAGSTAGTNAVPRSNVLSFDVTTGVLNKAFAPIINSQVKAVAASPDGTRLYVGGSFTSVNGVTHNRIVALDPLTGETISTFKGSFDYTVNAIVATNTTVYVGGAFSSAGGVSRNRLAALQASSGAVLPWTANADGTVNALALTAGESQVIAGGSFKNIEGAANYGMAALKASNGDVLPWAATAVVRNAGPNSAILSLNADANNIYGTGYVYGGGGNLEGAFAANGTTGKILWIEDCHGDTYDTFPVNNVVYTVSHAHFCANIGGFPDSNPKSVNQRHALAFTAATTGTVRTNTGGSTYFNFAGQPSPSLTNWFPDLDAGTYTGKSQAAWSITGNSQYIVLGGEFPRVNGVAQQGLVRFAIKQLAPKKQGPKLSGANFQPTLQLLANGVKVSWPSNYDNDSLILTYKVIRDGNVAAPIRTVSATSTFWGRPTMSYSDTAVGSGTHSYRIEALDEVGNSVTGNTVSITRTAPAQGAPLADVNGQQSTAKGGADARPAQQPTGSSDAGSPEPVSVPATADPSLTVPAGVQSTSTSPTSLTTLGAIDGAG